MDDREYGCVLGAGGGGATKRSKYPDGGAWRGGWWGEGVKVG